MKKLSNSEKSMLPDDTIEDNNNETNLDITFLNPSLEVQCELCDFVAKNIKGLKIHTKSKHTKSMKFKCDICNFETNNKKLNNDHKTNKCSKQTFCEFCSESFDTQDVERIHIRNNHPKVKDLHCEICHFETNIKKLFQDHQASKCSKIILCDFECGKSFETEEEINEHMKAIYW